MADTTLEHGTMARIIDWTAAYVARIVAAPSLYLDHDSRSPD